MTVSKTAAALLAVFGLIVAAGYGMLVGTTPGTTTGRTILEPPWERAPLAATKADIRAARDLARYLRTLPGDGNQDRIRALEWTRGWYDRPIGNLDRAALRKLLAGNRFVYRNAVLDPWSRSRDRRIHVQHFGVDGILRTCEGGHWQRHRYHVVNDLAGAATYATRYIGRGRDASPARRTHRDPDAAGTGWWTQILTTGGAWYGRPVTFDARTGTLAVHSENPDGTWSQFIGHVQTVPFQRTGNACSEGLGAATGLPATGGSGRSVRPVVPLFHQDPARPLRLGVYFSLYPPPEGRR